LITYYSLDELYETLVWSEPQCCQGCRARIALLYCPRLVDMFLDFWCRTGEFPQSPSWVEAIPKQQCTMWAKEIQAGLEAATAPVIDASREMSFLSELRNGWVAGESGDRDMEMDLT